MNDHQSGRALVARGWGLLTLVVTAVGIDTFNNVEFGLEAGGHLIAGSMAVAAACLVMLPWGGLMGWIRAVCLAMTVFAALNAYAAILGADMLAKNAAAEKHAVAQVDAARARAVIDSITERGAVSELESLVAAAKAAVQAAEDRAAKAEAEDTARMGGRQSCFKYCKRAREAVKPERDALRAALDRLSQAKARDAAKVELAKAQAKAENAPDAEANSLASAIAAWTGADANRLTRAFIVAIAGLGIMVTVSVATLGQSAFAMIGEGRALLRKEKAARAKARPVTVPGNPTKAAKKESRRGRKPAGRTRAEALAILQEHARRSGGVIVGSNATLARLVDVSPSTLGDARKGWLVQWEREGAVRVVSKDRGRKVVSVTGIDEKAA